MRGLQSGRQREQFGELPEGSAGSRPPWRKHPVGRAGERVIGSLQDQPQYAKAMTDVIRG